MEKFSTHTGVGVPLRESDVDTDQIIPAVYLKRITKTGFDDALFASWRKNEDFILNQEPFKHGSVLVAGPDFGTGSSREHAVWALRDYGFKAVLSSRFGDIFRGNSGKQGLLTAQLDQADIELIWKVLENAPGTEITVDLESRTVSCGSVVARFSIDDYIRWRLLEGLDDIALTMVHEQEITDYEAKRPSFKPTTLPARVESTLS
ncbi:3-isopropylmalate dehydratase small subunit [Psychromicrobium lacuslunae]|uniref:3-isopropylmalate dehydratase small subunit n=1 Tax=Psychromicrobium lacuslunae TaxID=1618207 RepID=A0A0D4BY37_9MICC|nr:3-isopropylmalate dehydratase small subunit [Psychromicrobium lacuslunae]AJT41248.1 isopropylmalate isomerase [Psychromicrobium lacuslunae]